MGKKEINKYKRTDIVGDEYELEIFPNTIIDDENITDDKKLIIHFFLDNFKYFKNNKKNFVSRDYTLSYVFNNIKDKEEFSYYFSYRLFALHYIIIQHFLPFRINALINKSRRLTMNILGSKDYDKFFLVYHQQEWINLKNDFVILEKAIKVQSEFESIIIWFVFATLAITNTETFMNLFRCVETLTREKYQIERTTQPKIKAILLNIGCDEDKAKRLIDIRNEIAHGHSVDIEFDKEMIELRLYLYPLIEKYIKKRIRDMNILGLKSPHLINDYIVFKNSQTKKEILVQSDDLENFKEFDKLTDFTIYTKKQIKDLAEKLGFEDDKIRYVLYCYDYHKNPP